MTIVLVVWVDPLALPFPPTMWVLEYPLGVSWYDTQPDFGGSLSKYSLSYSNGSGQHPPEIVDLYRPPSWLRQQLRPGVPGDRRTYRRTMQSVENEHGMWWAYEPVNGPR